jgi:hypothetical protein
VNLFPFIASSLGHHSPLEDSLSSWSSFRGEGQGLVVLILLILILMGRI